MAPNSEAVMAKKIKNENMTPTEKKTKRKTSISVENGDPIAENPAKKSKVLSQEPGSPSPKEIRIRLEEESAFVAGIVSLMYIPKHKQPGEVDDDEDDGEISNEAKNRLFGKSSRAQTVDELQERLQKKMAELRGNRKEDGMKKNKVQLTKVEKNGLYLFEKFRVYF